MRAMQSPSAPWLWGRTTSLRNVQAGKPAHARYWAASSQVGSSTWSRSTLGSLNCASNRESEASDAANSAELNRAILEDVKELRSSQGFNRYYVPKLKRRQADIQKRMMDTELSDKYTSQNRGDGSQN